MRRILPMAVAMRVEPVGGPLPAQCLSGWAGPVLLDTAIIVAAFAVLLAS